MALLFHILKIYLRDWLSCSSGHHWVHRRHICSSPNQNGTRLIGGCYRRPSKVVIHTPVLRFDRTVYTLLQKQLRWVESTSILKLASVRAENLPVFGFSGYSFLSEVTHFWVGFRHRYRFWRQSHYAIKPSNSLRILFQYLLLKNLSFDETRRQLRKLPKMVSLAILQTGHHHFLNS